MYVLKLASPVNHYIAACEEEYGIKTTRTVASARKYTKIEEAELDAVSIQKNVNIYTTPILVGYVLVLSPSEISELTTVAMNYTISPTLHHKIIESNLAPIE